VALTDLRPVGRVSFDGINYEARARFGYIEKGERVRLVEQERFTALVDKIVA
jgi:membrane-bound ClpP family serine protease